MIILDMNQVMISNLFAHMGNQNGEPLNEGMLRHMVLNSIRAYRLKHHQEFGELVIACDSRSWRKDVFPYYKANREKSKEALLGMDWKQLFETLNIIREELKRFFPYRVIQVEGAEADDIIATLVHKYGTEFGNGAEKILILSGDKDFKQLHRYNNVSQFDPVQKKWVKTNNPDLELKEHIIRGDAGDGVPNIFSDDDTFVAGKRQKPATAKRVKEILDAMDGLEQMSGPITRNICRNKQLIDLTAIPTPIKDKIQLEFEAQGGKGRDKLLNYFIDKRLSLLTQSIGDF